MRRKLIIILLLINTLCIPLFAQQDDLLIYHISKDKTQIKVKAIKQYLLIPIEEKAPEADINIMQSGNISQKIDVRLARNNIDYYVPLDLRRYKDKVLVLSVNNGSSRTSIQSQQEDVCWKAIKQSDIFDSTNVEKFRPAFHHTPIYGWMNDPNGLLYKDGIFHLYFQHNPYASVWGNMNWGHSTSRDLIHWQHLPVAISPDGLGMIFSGSTVVDEDNTAGFGKNAIIAVYTSAASTQSQSLSYSNDNGITFTKYEGNPIIVSDKECRDDKVFWNTETRKWNLVLADALEHQVWFYSSSDLKQWVKEGSFGKEYGSQGCIWECPDLMELPVNGTSAKKWVLTVNVNPSGPSGGSATEYFVGDFDGKQFNCESRPNVTKWMDYGKDHYAAVSWNNSPGGRHIIIAWMSNCQYSNMLPTIQFRSADTLPRDISLFKGSDGEYYIKTIPSPELYSLRGKENRYGSFNIGRKIVQKELPSDSNGLYEISINVSNTDVTNIILCNNDGDKVLMTYDAKEHTFSMDRRKSGQIDFSPDFPCVTTAPTTESHNQKIRLFIDRCSIEAFDEDGRFVMTNLIFPHNTFTTILIDSKSRSRVNDLTVWSIKV